MIRSTQFAFAAALMLGSGSALVQAASSEQPSVPLPPSAQSPSDTKAPDDIKSNSVPTSESSGVKRTVTDAGITTKLKAKLLADEMTSGMQIHVDTQHGTVNLTGEAKSPAEKARAEELAMATDGVTKVNNGLVVRAQ